MTATLTACFASLWALSTPQAPHSNAAGLFLQNVAAISKDFANTMAYFPACRRPPGAIQQPQIPSRVLSASYDWVRKVLREPYAKSVVGSAWVAFPNSKHVNEPLTTYARLGEGGLVWCDTPRIIFLLIDVGEKANPDGEEAREDWVFRTLAKYLKLREFPKEQVSYWVKKEPDSTNDIWAGHIRRGPLHNGHVASGDPHGWDCSLQVAADGRFLYVRISTRDEQLPIGGRVKGPEPGDPLPGRSRFDK